MSNRIWIKTGHCCGDLCAYVYQDTSWDAVILASEHDEIGFQKYAKAPARSVEEAEAEWDSWFASIKKMLAGLVETGQITQEQADAALEEWLKDHPDPTPEEQAYDVSEEFARNPIRVDVHEDAEV